MSHPEAYWISPKGELLPVYSLHIHEVIKDPVRFGLKLEDIEKVFQRFDEPLGHEGFARDEIMAGLLKSGWIRLRYQRRNVCWTVQTFRFDKATLGNLKSWTRKNARSGVSPHCDVRLLSEAGEEVLPIRDLRAGGRAFFRQEVMGR